MKKMTVSPPAETRRRYPGPYPFSFDDQHIFRGRLREVGELQELLHQYNQLLLHARSGIGKSSLLNAGLLPALEREGKYECFRLVFGAHNKKEPLPPLDSTIVALQQRGPSLNYLDKLIFQENSLWYHLKRLQACAKFDEQPAQQKDAPPPPERQILLIFDQFEEIFTYPAEDVASFKSALNEALYTLIPDTFRQALREKGASDALPAVEVELLHRPLPLRILFSIRSDRLAELDKFTDSLPDILKTLYEIKPLTREQTTQAIVEPAQMPREAVTPPLDSSPFRYDLPLLADILRFLAEGQGQYVESFQVQIICKHIEDLVTKAQGEKTVVTRSDVPLGLENIFFNFCNHAFEQVPSLSWYAEQEQATPTLQEQEQRREATRRMVEKDLIFRTAGQESGIRLPLFREQIADAYPDVDGACLRALTHERLLRETPDAAGRMRFEISHDTLVKPILRARDKREQEAKSKADLETLRQLEREESTRKSREIGVSGKVEIDWDYIARIIQEGRVVLILGEDALRDAEGIPLTKRFVQRLDATERKFTYYPEEQLFAFDNRLNRTRLAYELRDFARENFQLPLLDYLARVHLPLIISFDPTGLLDARFRNDPHVATDYYYRHRPSNNLPKGNRLIYNLFGSVEEPDSLLLTHEDSYEHFAALLLQPPLQIKRMLAEAEAIVLFGVNLQRSMNEAILWTLLHDNSRALKISLMDRAEPGADELRMKAVFNLGFHHLPPENFMKELLDRLHNNAGKSPGSSQRPGLDKQEIQQLIAKSELDLAFEKLMRSAREGTFNKDVTSEIFLLSSNFNQLNRSFRGSLIDNEVAQRERSKIANALLRLTDSIDFDQNSSI